MWELHHYHLSSFVVLSRKPWAIIFLLRSTETDVTIYVLRLNFAWNFDMHLKYKPNSHILWNNLYINLSFYQQKLLVISFVSKIKGLLEHTIVKIFTSRKDQNVANQ